MKKIFLLLFALCNATSYIVAQVGVSDEQRKNSRYLLYIENFYMSQFYDDGRCEDNYFYVKGIDKNGQETDVANLNFVNFIDNAGDKDINFNLCFLLTNEKIIQIKLKGYMRDKSSNGYCNSNTQRINPEKYINTNDCDNVSNQVWIDENNDNELKLYVSFGYKNLPLHYISSVVGSNIVNTYFPANDKITITDRADFPLSYYHFQYSVDQTNWIDIDNSFVSSNTLNISAKDLWGNNYIDYAGKNISIRAVSCFDNGSYQSWSNYLTLKVIPSAPHIVSYQTNPTMCYDSNDGTLNVHFDRNLLDNETLEPILDGIDYSGNFTIDFANDVLNFKLTGLNAGTHTLSLIGKYNIDGKETNTFTDGVSHQITFTIEKPDPVIFTAQTTDVNCYQGNDGTIEITASSGQNHFQYTTDAGNHWIDFDNGTQTTIRKLAAGSYTIKVRDTNGCIAKETDGNEKEVLLTISQPQSAMSMPNDEIEVFNATGYGLSNAYISVRILGGTPFDNGTYSFEWHKDTPDGTLITNNITTDALNNPFTIKINNITAGKYYLTVKDKNFANATDHITNCGFVAHEFVVTQPDPLVVNISLEKCISCNIANAYEYKKDNNGNNIPDEAEDAIVKATVKGGVLPYNYQWQLKNGDTYTDITAATSNLLEGITQGTYKIKIIDNNNNQTDAELLVPFPEELKINTTGSQLKCNELSDGKVEVALTGGRTPYTYEWNTTDKTAVVNGLSAGNYFVFVKDASNCMIKGTATVQQPEGMTIDDLSVINPLCYGASNGSIHVKVTGGVTPYLLKWSNGMSGEQISGLGAGTYTLTFTDGNGCTAQKTYTLTQPDPFRIELDNDITLCRGDSKVFDISIDDNAPTYRWTNEQGTVISSAPTITISEAGTYTATVTTSKGCIASDEIKISLSNNVLQPEFMLPSHAYMYETVNAVNTSPINPETLKWEFPDPSLVQIQENTDEKLSLNFNTAGTYKIGLTATQGECKKTIYKDILIENSNLKHNNNSNQNISNVETYAIAPNPNNGNYNIVVTLKEKSAIRLRIVDMYSNTSYASLDLPEAISFNVPFNQSINKGVYLVVLETGNELWVKKMIVF